MIRYVKTPGEILDYGWDWSQVLPAAARLTGVTHTVPLGVTLESETYGTDTTTVWLSGGTAGQRYLVTATATDDGGRTYARTFQLVVDAYRSEA